jgi:hypothetical protein
MMHKRSAAFIAGCFLAAPTASFANDDAAEFWFNPAASFELNDDTGMEIETAQRFRNVEDGRSDTYFVRLWINQQVDDTFTLSGAVERRINDDGSDESRLIQQLSGKHGLLRTRLRLEQRFVDDADRMGLRLRPRLGVAIPIDQQGRWSFKSDAELFLTMRSNNAGGQEGLTGIRTQVGVGYDISERLSLSAVYLRQEEFKDEGPDEVGHAPLIGIGYAF